MSLQRESDSYLLRRVHPRWWQKKLKPYGFIRIHRSALVTSFVIKPYATESMVSRLKVGRITYLHSR